MGRGDKHLPLPLHTFSLLALCMALGRKPSLHGRWVGWGDRQRDKEKWGQKEEDRRRDFPREGQWLAGKGRRAVAGFCSGLPKGLCFGPLAWIWLCTARTTASHPLSRRCQGQGLDSLLVEKSGLLLGCGEERVRRSFPGLTPFVQQLLPAGPGTTAQDTALVTRGLLRSLG